MGFLDLVIKWNDKKLSRQKKRKAKEIRKGAKFLVKYIQKIFYETDLTKIKLAPGACNHPEIRFAFYEKEKYRSYGVALSRSDFKEKYPYTYSLLKELHKSVVLKAEMEIAYEILQKSENLTVTYNNSFLEIIRH